MIGSIALDDPISRIIALLIVESDSHESWITDANKLCCDLVGWPRGNYGDPRDPDCLTQTLIGKSLDVLVPPEYRAAHRMARQMFTAKPTPRTMGEGRDTPLWIRQPDQIISGLDSIAGDAVTVLIGLSAIDPLHTVAAIQPMNVGKSFALPKATTTQQHPHLPSAK